MPNPATVASTLSHQRQVRASALDDGSVLLTASSRSPTVDLAEVPAGIKLRVRRLEQASEITITGAADHHHISVEQPVSVTIDGSLGLLTVSYKAAATRTPPTLAGHVKVIRAEKGTMDVTAARAGKVELRGGTLSGEVSGIELWTTVGDCLLPAKVGTLRVSNATNCILVPSRASVAVLDLTERGPAPLTLAPLSERRTGPVTATLAVTRSVASVGHELRLSGPTLSIASLDGTMTVSGSGVVQVPANREVTDLTIAGKVAVSCGAGSALRRFEGILRVAQCRDAMITAPDDGFFEYAGIITNDKADPDIERLRGATLRRVLISDNADGRRFLRHFQYASVVEPYVKAMRVRRASWRLPLYLALTRLKNRSHSLRELEDATFFSQELAKLVNDKSGSGSIRTKVNWAAYRGRQLSSQSWWERATLGLFRLVGFGQRPGPALLCWVVVASLATITSMHWIAETWPSMALPASERLMVILDEALFMLLSPFFLLRLAGDPQLVEVTGRLDLILVLVRTIVAAPFVFFVVAVSRFLRAEWPLPSR